MRASYVHGKGDKTSYASGNRGARKVPDFLFLGSRGIQGNSIAYSRFVLSRVLRMRDAGMKNAGEERAIAGINNFIPGARHYSSQRESAGGGGGVSFSS